MDYKKIITFLAGIFYIYKKEIIKYLPGNILNHLSVEKVPSKKEKKKEKKKLQRKRKAAGIDDDDVSAGLILPATTQPVLNSDDIDNRLVIVHLLIKLSVWSL